jgi:hypothetical protein
MSTAITFTIRSPGVDHETTRAVVHVDGTNGQGEAIAEPYQAEQEPRDAHGAAHRLGDRVPLALGRFEPRAACLEVLARAHGDLARVLDGLPDDRADPVVLVPEDVMQQEDGALHRRERLEHDEEANDSLGDRAEHPVGERLELGRSRSKTSTSSIRSADEVPARRVTAKPPGDVTWIAAISSNT